VPSAAANTGGSYDSTGIVTHSHGGKVHSHKLPASGLNHSHTVGSGAVAPAPTYTPPVPTPVYRPPAPAPVYRPPATPVPQPTPAPAYQAQPQQNGAVAHSHGGRVHSHRLPASGLNHTHNISGSNPAQPPAPAPIPQYNVPQYGAQPQYTQPPVTTQPTAQGVTHSHCGRVHTHPLPPQGLNHTHTNINCTAGGQAMNTAQPQQRPQVQPQVPYDYSSPTSGSSNSSGSATYYDNANTAGSTNTTTSSNNYYNDYNAAPPAQGSYYDNARPKQPASYGDTSNSYYDYSAPKADTGTAASTTSDSFAPSNFSGGDTYTVQRGDTVFQVMRNTGVYWKDIIRLNNLQAPNYQINPGQQLRLR